MLKHKDIKQRIANEFRYIATKMEEVDNINRKLFYFSAIFGETGRSLNLEWDVDIAFIHMVTSHVYQQINNQIQQPVVLQSLPIDWTSISHKITIVASDLATYFEEAKNSKEELYQILCGFAEISYAVSGNGSYLLEKGTFKL